MPRFLRPFRLNPVFWILAIVGVALGGALLLSLSNALAAGSLPTSMSTSLVTRAAETPPPSANYPPILGVPCTTCKPQQSAPQGIPAIKAQAQAMQGTGAHFMAADVKAYLTAHPPSDTVPNAPALTVTSVQFLTASEVSAQLQGESTGEPPSTLLCLVTISGTFQNTWAPLPGPAATFHSGVMVFDATTGNLLVSSVG